MSHDETPLLSSDDDAIYSRYSNRQKRILLGFVSCCGLMPLFISGSFIPCIPQIAKDLNSTPSVVTLGVSLSVFAGSTGGLSGATYATFYGRRSVYLVGLPLFVIGSIGVGLSTSIPMLMTTRFIQAFGASPGLSVGAAVIGDIYKLEQRGSAMGVFLAACLLGPALAPPVGGFVAAYFSWRIMQFGLGVTGFLIFIMILSLFPETSHPGTRGIDKLPPGASKIVFLNPLRPLWLLRSPNILLVGLANFNVIMANWVMMIPLAYTLGPKYDIVSPALIGACFLPSGIGNMAGAPLGGTVSDRIVVAWRARRKGVWYPEDRLRVTLPAALFGVPLSLIFCTLAMEYVPGPVGLTMCLVCLFMNGLSVDVVVGTSSAYVVDILRDRSAEGVAALVCLRGVLIAFATSGIIPLVETYGVLRTNLSTALLGWLGYLMLWITVTYGNEMRNWIDIGYTIKQKR